MLWLLKSTVSLRWNFWAPKTYVKTDMQENIYNFTLKKFAYLITPVAILCWMMGQREFNLPARSA